MYGLFKGPHRDYIIHLEGMEWDIRGLFGICIENEKVVFPDFWLSLRSMSSIGSRVFV